MNENNKEKKFEAFVDRPKGAHYVKSNEWYTPKSIFDKLKINTCFDCDSNFFDLDPASNCDANKIVNAKKYYSLENGQDGLQEEWKGKIWLNPPYSIHTKDWLEKAIEVGYDLDSNNQIYALVFARTDTKWFQEVATQFQVMCFIKGRIRFINGETLKESSSAGAGSLLLSIGAEFNDRLIKSNMGFIVDNRKYQIRQRRDIINT